jgi:hypothetical protein
MQHNPSAPAGGGFPGAADASAQMLAMMQQQQQQFMQAMAAQQQALTTAMQAMAQPQQVPSQTLLAAQMLSLTSLGQLRAFDGRPGSTGLALQEWLSHAEHYFAARESAMGILAAQGDAHRVHATRAALTHDAQSWYSSLPDSKVPNTWSDFKTELTKRFDSASSAQVKEAALQRFVDAARRVRDKLNLEGIQRYTTLFEQHASRIAPARMTDASKRLLYAQGLPSRYAEMVLTEDAKEIPLGLHEVAQSVLAKASMRAHASSGGYPYSSPSPAAASPGSTGRADAMEIDAISVCAAQFGIPYEEASRYLEPQEGWAPHETHSARYPAASGPASAAAAPSPPPDRQTGSTDGPQLERLLAAFESRYGKPSSGQGKGQSQRRNAPNDLAREVPSELANARKEAGLCIKCGITRYESGSKGHNARTCKLPVDKTTNAVEGRKKANF